MAPDVAISKDRLDFLAARLVVSETITTSLVTMVLGPSNRSCGTASCPSCAIVSAAMRAAP